MTIALTDTVKLGYDTTTLSLDSSGEARYTIALLQSLRRFTGIEIEILTASRRVPGSRMQRRAYQALAEGLYYPLLVGRRVRRRAVDLVHYPRHLVSAQGGVEVPTVLTVADVFPVTHPQYYDAATVRHYRLMTPGAARRATRVITHSKASQSDITRRLRIPPERVAVVPHGVGDQFRPVARDERWLQRRFGVDGPYVLCVATLEPRKNLARAIVAMDRLQPQFPSHALVLTGGRGWLSAELDVALSRTRSRVVVTGYVSDEELVRLYAAAECFLFASLLEGFGFPVLEAMACGAPVVTSDRSSLPEVAGDAAVLVDPYSTEAIAEGIARVLGSSELRTELRDRGLERSARFTWRAAAEATVRVYQEALAAHGERGELTARRSARRARTRAH